MTLAHDQKRKTARTAPNAAPVVTPRAPRATPLPLAPKQAEEGWERRYTGTQDGVTFHLRLRRHPDGLLSARYMVEGGHGEGFHLDGVLLRDGTFSLRSDENHALFEGRVLTDGDLHVDRFRRGKDPRNPSYELKDLVLTPLGERRPFGVRNEPVTEEQNDEDDSVETDRPVAQSWSRTFQGELAGSTLTLLLKRESDGRLDGSFILGTVGHGTASGQLHPGGRVTLTVRYASGRFEGQERQIEGVIDRGPDARKLDTNADGRHDHDGSVLPVQLRGKWLGGAEPYDFATTVATAGPAADGPSAWEGTLSPERRARIAALREDGFLEELDAVCGRLGVPRDLVLAVMALESRVDPGQWETQFKKNVGLIQFGAGALHDINRELRRRGDTEVKDLQHLSGLSAKEQLRLVEIYFRQHGLQQAIEKCRRAGKPVTLEHVYMAVLGGHALYAENETWVRRDGATPGERAKYEANRGLDSDDDGRITTEEAADKVRLRWREMFDTNIDERSRHLRIEKGEIVYDENYLDPRSVEPRSIPRTDEQDEDASEVAPDSREGLKLQTQERLRAIRKNNLVGQVIGELDGVPAYYNGDRVAATHGEHYSGTGKTGYRYGLKWRCVEFVRRYFYLAKRIEISGRGNAIDYHTEGLDDGDTAKRRGLIQFNNMSSTKPSYGDLIVFRNPPFGHVGIISNVAGDSITVVQQNITTKSAAVFTTSHSLSKKQNKWTVGDDALSWLRGEA